jgi:mannosylglycoprotein endo-beta-mannosidase
VDKAIKAFSFLMSCSIGQWPIKYLGVPVSGSRLHVKDWVYLDEKILKRLDGWKSASLSYGGKLILLNACLSSTPTYAMSMYLLPKTLVKKNGQNKEKILLARQ